MRSWPTVVVPSVNFLLPKLTLKLTQGELDFSQREFRMYVCGVTPYDATHLGHAATYLTFDLINRYLRCQGESVDFVENVTDIDDPLLVRAERDSINWLTLANSQIDLYTSDMTALRVLPPKNFESVTESIDLITRAISKLIESGSTYSVAGDIYFRCTPFLSEMPISYEQALAIFRERGGDPDRIGKEEPLDPLLWLSNKNDDPGWEAEFGLGRPGWHIECSVIALRYLLGEDYLDSNLDRKYAIDLQGGGSDLIFPHHFMSAMLAKALTGKEFAQGYLHTGMIGLDGEKMSKSRGNLVFISTLLKSGVDPMVLRYALLDSRYSSDRMWSEAALTRAHIKVADLRQGLARMEVPDTKPVIEAVISALADDLDTHGALKALSNWVAEGQNASLKNEHGNAGELSRAIDSLLGLAL